MLKEAPLKSLNRMRSPVLPKKNARAAKTQQTTNMRVTRSKTPVVNNSDVESSPNTAIQASDTPRIAEVVAPTSAASNLQFATTNDEELSDSELLNTSGIPDNGFESDGSTLSSVMSIDSSLGKSASDGNSSESTGSLSDSAHNSDRVSRDKSNSAKRQSRSSSSLQSSTAPKRTRRHPPPRVPRNTPAPPSSIRYGESLNPFVVMGASDPSDRIRAPHSTAEQTYREKWLDEIESDVSELRQALAYNYKRNSPMRSVRNNVPSFTQSSPEPDSREQPSGSPRLRRSPARDARSPRSLRPSASGKSSPKPVDDPKTTAHNDDYCSACILGGDLLCCDTCTRSFHPECVEEGIVPEDEWFCRDCLYKKRKKNPSKYPEQISRTSKSVLFGPILEQLSQLNAKVFELPTELRNRFENVWTHPVTGEYIDLKETEVSPINSTRNETPPELQTKKSDEPNSKIAVCYHCRKTGVRLNHSSLLNSHAIDRPISSYSRPYQVDRSPLIKCDYCDMHWHLDCLDPPLRQIPTSLDPASAEIVDSLQVQKLKLKAWGESVDFGATGFKIRRRWMCPLHVDWVVPSGRVLKRLGRRSVRDHKQAHGDVVGRTINAMPSTSDNSSTGGTASKIRASNSRPGYSSFATTSSNTKMEYLPQGRNVFASAAPVNYEIENEASASDSAIFESLHPRLGYPHIVPEKAIKLDFLSRIKKGKNSTLSMEKASQRMRRARSAIPDGLDVRLSSKMSELYTKKEEGGNLKESSYPSLRCSKEEADVWLESVCKLQLDVAKRLKERADEEDEI